MKTEAGMYGVGTRLGLGGAVSWAFAVKIALRWCVLTLAVVLLPEVAWGQQLELKKMLEAQRDEDAWKKVVDCKGAEKYLAERPQGRFADEARECLDAIADEEDMRRMKRYEEGAYKALERGNVAGARRRLEAMRKLAEMAPEVMDLQDAIDEAEEKEKLGKMREYAKTGHEAVGRGDLEKAGRYVERMRGLDAESSLVVELEEAIAEVEAERKVVERRQAEAERKAAEERRRAEAERKAREAEERRRAEAERKEREAEERRRRAQAPGTKLRDCPECPELVVVPEGTYRMGSPESESGRGDDEGPVHPVTIGYRLAVGVKEVTRGEFARFVSETGRSMGDSCWTYEGGEWEERSGRHWKSPGFSQTDGHPVVCVNWDDAKAYVEWLSRKTGKAYRLLSEAEWEYVARAGATTEYWWGDDIGQNRANCGPDNCGDSYNFTAPVGSFSANPFGLHDVHGNVWEWTEDCWNESYAGAPSDGNAWESGNCGRRVVRGGSWGFGPRVLRSAFRVGDVTGVRSSDNGFRIARTLTP